MINFRTLLMFYRRHLRVQPLRELMAVMGVAAGVALFFAVQVANSSITGSFEQLVHGVAGRATVEVAARSPEGFSESIYEEIAGTSGVRAAAPILERRIVASGPAGSRALTLVGADQRLTALGGTLATQFDRVGESSKRGSLVMTEPIARAIGAMPGGLVSIKIGALTDRLALGAMVPDDKVGPLADSPVAAASLAVVQSLAGLPNRLTRILIEPRGGRGREVERALSRRFGTTLNVRPVNTEARLLSDAAGPEGRLSALFSLISLAVGMILAYNVASGERRAFIGHLRESGMPELAIVASLVFDALILGAAGCALGLLLGSAVSELAYRSVPGYLAAAFPIGDQRIVSLETVFITIVAGMLAAFGAGALPFIGPFRGRATRGALAGAWISPADKPRWANTTVFAFGVALAAMGTTISLLTPSTSIVALVAVVVGLVSCVPMFVRHMLRLAGTAARRSSDAAARLSTGELQASPTRSIALVAASTVAVFLLVTIGGAVADVQRAVRAGAGATLSSAELWINPGGSANIYSTEPFSSGATQSALERVSAVRSVLPFRESFLDLRTRRIWVIGVPPQAPSMIAPSQLVTGALASATKHLREGGWVVMSQTLANRDHLRIGESFSLPTPSGAAAFRLAGTISNYGWLPGTVIMNGGEYGRLWGEAEASQLAVTLRPGVPVARGKLAVEQALPSGSALTVQGDAERQSQITSVLGSTLSRLDQTSTIVLIAVIATVVAMMVGAVWRRRSRLDALMAIGMSFAQLARLVFYESGCVLLGGCLLGLAGGILGQDLVDGWIRHTTGSPVRFYPAWELGLRTVLIASLISIGVAVLAVLRTVRFQPKAVLSAG
jgi:putative ABC transport system permease protein